jgi:hypothetical protein
MTTKAIILLLFCLFGYLSGHMWIVLIPLPWYITISTIQEVTKQWSGVLCFTVELSRVAVIGITLVGFMLVLSKIR